METTALRQFLEGLCNSSCWDYAVFWKLRHQIPAVLSWEDGYCNQPRPRTSTENSLDMLCFDGSSEISFFGDESSLIYGTAIQYPIELLIADMSCQQHSLGEGLVGRVACMYNYHWISSEDISATQFEYDKTADFQEEWLPHLLAGVKTVLLVSVHPYGVLQLGSSAEVVEDAALVDHIKESFITHQVLYGYHTSLTSEEDLPLFSSPSLDDMDEPLYITNAEIAKKVLHEESPVDSEESNESNTSTFGSLQEIFEDLDENKDLIHAAIGLSGLLVPLNEPFEPSQLEMLQSEQFSVSCLGANLPGVCNRVVDSYITGNITTGPCGEVEEDAPYSSEETLSSIFSTPMDYDLFEALGQPFQSQTSGFPGYEALPVDIRGFPCGMEPSAWELGEGNAMVKTEDLLEAVIANFFDGLDETSPNSSETLSSSAAPIVQCDTVPSSKSLNRSKGIFNGCGDNSVLWSNIEATFATGNGSSSSKHSHPASSKSSVSNSSNILVSCLTNKERPGEGQKNQLSGSKRKGRSGDCQRPRPRDRQLIQDRVKELRGLVPNGSKCSIDALLDRTVKHMLFLRSVTNQAEKLRKCVLPKDGRPKIWKSLGIEEEDYEKKRGWAFDFGSEFQVFPIVVEDLEHPGQMLIEMMCDEQGLFFEIAQVIRRLELTILKGVTESRSNNTWASFVVEASKGFQRTEIFWPLMQVLQQRGKPISSIV